jgi:osmotically-inducible protein OsmY
MNTKTPENTVDLSVADGVTELEARVRSRLSGQVRDFRLLVGDKGVTLRGRTRTYYAKQLAQHAVMEAMVLPIVANEIEVS